jgi:hypothetical protein
MATQLAGALAFGSRPASGVPTRPEVSSSRESGLLPLSDGLTFARYRMDGRHHTLALVADDGDQVTGVDLGVRLGLFPSDPLECFAGYSHDELFAAVSAAVCEGAVVRLSRRDLDVPLTVAGHHVAAALNYPDHAAKARSASRQQPFLFPKLAPATPWHSTFAMRGRTLMDDEIEVAVALSSDSIARRPQGGRSRLRARQQQTGQCLTVYPV